MPDERILEPNEVVSWLMAPLPLRKALAVHPSGATNELIGLCRYYGCELYVSDGVERLKLYIIDPNNLEEERALLFMRQLAVSSARKR